MCPYFQEGFCLGLKIFFGLVDSRIKIKSYAV